MKNDEVPPCRKRVRRATNDYVEREERRDAFRQDATKAWDAYQATRLHATFGEPDAWLANLEAGQDVEPPECDV